MKRHIVLSLLACLIAGVSSASIAMDQESKCPEDIKAKYRAAKRTGSQAGRKLRESNFLVRPPENIKVKHREAKRLAR